MDGEQLILSSNRPEQFKKFEDAWVGLLEAQFGQVVVLKDLKHEDGRPSCLRIYEARHNGRRIRFRVYENEERPTAELRIANGALGVLNDEIKKPKSICLGNHYNLRCRFAIGDIELVDCWIAMAGNRKKQCNKYQPRQKREEL
jgi:hypothetical protein